MKYLAIIPVLLVLLIGITSCWDDIVCSDQFVSIEFHVLDSSGLPVDSLTITVTNARTDEIYDVRQPQYEAGLYFVLDDGFRTKIRSYGDPILVHGAGDNLEFDAEFIIGLDENACHVEKLAGPETVLLADP